MCSDGEAARQSGKEHLLMYSKVLSGLVQGIDGTLISVETDIHDGLPVMNMVGYLSCHMDSRKFRQIARE